MNDYELLHDPFLVWLEANISGKKGGHDPVWPIVFATTCWWIWKWRNSRAFDRIVDISVDPLSFLMARMGDSEL